MVRITLIPVLIAGDTVMGVLTFGWCCSVLRAMCTGHSSTLSVHWKKLNTSSSVTATTRRRAATVRYSQLDCVVRLATI